MNKLLIFEKIGDSDKTRPAFLVKKPGGGGALWFVWCMPYIVGGPYLPYNARKTPHKP
ncbi:MAG TPA: hypothetical protein H9846_04805 [Candidatus Gemmiger excrementipullorum]|uniref:Uncharacterized protein n=1 Tax=Candidatus Gemmiger excrementipullorum TaxID=2838610 RepID=A0A9D1Y103_9FIRM|nr:hypothetical protein [Candidatus Gemmiger excrementipullorum]